MSRDVTQITGIVMDEYVNSAPAPAERLDFDWCRPREAERLVRVSALLRFGAWVLRCLFWMFVPTAGLALLLTVFSLVYLLVTMGGAYPFFSASLGTCCALSLLAHLADELQHRWQERSILLVAMAAQLREEHRSLRGESG